MKILAIETSCDETAAAIVEDGTKIISSVVATSKEMHEKYGGIVPEVAARAQLEYIVPTVSEALTRAGTDYQHIDALAVTIGPGLIGSLLVGVETAKTIAFVTGKPVIPVNHVVAHMYANFVTSESPARSQSPPGRWLNGPLPSEAIAFPAISLVVSGGHTELYLMKNELELTWLGGTIDDAAGEAFDKTARLLGFGHGGGPAIQEAASKSRLTGGSPMRRLPRPMLDEKNKVNFSFSGLKTAILREVQKLQDKQTLDDNTIAQLSYEVQEAITDVLVKKTLRAAEAHNAASILLSGGVSANLRLREKFSIQHPAIDIHAPPVHLCTDNAVYIAACAYFRGKKTPWKDITAVPDLSVEVSS